MAPPERRLAIETASEACSVALSEGGDLIAYDHREIGRGHAETLVPMIAGLPANGRAQRIEVSLGPGSFTGVRIGLATARALGVAWGAPVVGYHTLALVAAQAAQITSGTVTVCMNGGHGEWFVAHWDHQRQPNEVQSLTPQQAVSLGANDVIAGNRAEEFATLLGDQSRALRLLPDARAVGLLDEAWWTDDLHPIYGRAPDATPQKAAGA